LSAIKDVIAEKNQVDISLQESYENLYHTNDLIKFDCVLLKPDKEEDKINELKQVLKGRANELSNKKTKSNYYTNYLYFKEQIEKNSEKYDLIQILDVFTTKFVVGIISFNSNKVSTKDEMEIFQNLNSKGRPLEEYDLIRNQIFNICSDEVLRTKETEIIRYYNQQFESKLDSMEKRELKERNDFFRILLNYFIGENEISDKSLTQSTLQQFKKFTEIAMDELFQNRNKNNLSLDDFKKYIDYIVKYFDL